MALAAAVAAAGRGVAAAVAAAVAAVLAGLRVGVLLLKLPTNPQLKPPGPLKVRQRPLKVTPQFVW